MEESVKREIGLTSGSTSQMEPLQPPSVSLCSGKPAGGVFIGEPQRQKRVNNLVFNNNKRYDAYIWYFGTTGDSGEEICPERKEFRLNPMEENQEYSPWLKIDNIYFTHFLPYYK